MGWLRAEGMGDLWEGEMRACELAGRRLLILMEGGRLHAYEDRCAHLGVALSEGRLEGGVLTCRAHEYTYRAATGEGINPARVRLKACPVKREGGEVWVDPGAQA